MFFHKHWMHFLLAWRSLLILPPEPGVDDEIVRQYPHNFIFNGLDAGTWLFGESFISVSAILPVYAMHITNSPLVIGLIPALTDIGIFLPQMFLAPFVERLPRKYPTVMKLAAIERVPYLILPFMVLWLDGLSRQVAVALFILLMAWKSFGTGVVSIPWAEMVAKIIPVSHRGRFFSVSHIFGQLFGIAGATIASLLLFNFPYPLNFALIFGIGAVAIWVSFFFLAQTREPSRPAPATHHAEGQYRTRLMKIIRSNANFRTYLVSRWFSYLGNMAIGFVAVYSIQKYALPDATAAVYTGILYATGVIGYMIWGPLGDRLGHKHVMELAITFWCTALCIALATTFFQIQWAIYLIFALMGISTAGGLLSDFNLAMEFGPEDERPTYIGLTRSLTGPALFISPILAGWIVLTFGYVVMFSVSLAFCLTGLVILNRLVKDPRFMEPRPSSQRLSIVPENSGT